MRVTSDQKPVFQYQYLSGLIDDGENIGVLVFDIVSCLNGYTRRFWAR